LLVLLEYINDVRSHERKIKKKKTSTCAVAYPGWDFIHILHSCAPQNTNEGQSPESQEF